MKMLFAALALLLLPAAVQADELHSFARGSWKELTKARAGQATVVHFWGLTCGPCLEELPNWTAHLKKRPDLKLVLVDSSPFGDEPGEVKNALTRAGLAKQENWLFADSFEERLRFEIDPKWRGEMPYTLLIGRDGRIEKVTGLMDFKKLDAWLDKQVKKT
ncbi:MAG TPA: TlpA disulfide reductase family protein [Rhizomicrobium sp.]|jgi:thiol-disulfide isomerase/thioredoxin